MPLNLLKVYSDLLELGHLPEPKRTESLLGVFKRDFENNPGLNFRKKTIRPVKKNDGVSAMQTLFKHLTTRDEEDEKGNKTGKRAFEMSRSERIHWIKYHLEEKKKDNIIIFSCEDNGIIRTYIHDQDTDYLIILEPYRNTSDYYLITAYYVNESRGKKQLKNKFKKKLDIVH